MQALLETLQANSVHWLAILLDAAVKGLVILAVTGVVTALLRRRSAALRHMVWSLAIIGLMLVPMLSIALPQLQVPIIPGQAAPVIEMIALSQPADLPDDILADDAIPALGEALPAALDDEQADSTTIAAATQMPTSQPIHWSAWVLLVWLVGLLVISLPME